MLKFPRTAAERLAVCLSLACAVALLASCGGGGDAPPSLGSFWVGYDRESISVAFDAGTTPPEGLVQASGHGRPDGALFVGADTPDGRPDPNIDHVQVEIQNSEAALVRVVVNPNLAPGTYHGTLLLEACADALCQRHYGNSPYRLAYTITVGQNVVFDPAVLHLESYIGEPGSATVAVQLPSDASGFTVSATDGVPVIDQLTPGGFRVTLPAHSIEGYYISYIAAKAGSHQRTLPIEHVVTRRPLRVDTLRLDLSAAGGQPASARVAVTSLEQSATGFTASSASTAPWLSVTDVDAGGFTVRAAPLPVGTYTGRVTVISGIAWLELPVTLTVTGSAAGEHPLQVAQRSLSFLAASGTGTGSQALGVVPASWNSEVKTAIAYTGGTGRTGWLSASVDAAGEVRAQVDAKGLPNGLYQATLTVRGAFPSPAIDVPVALTVGDGLAIPASQTVAVGSDTTAGSLPGSIPVLTNRPQAVRWSATSSVPWLRLTRASGAIGTAVEYEVDVAQALQMAPYTDVAGQVVISAETDVAAPGTGFVSVAALVTLRRELAEVSGIGPAQLVAGRPASVIVRGRGFDHLLDPAARLLIDGVAPSGVIRLSPTALQVALPALAAGERSVAVTNAAGLPTPVGVLRVVDAVAHTAASFDTGGTPVTVLHDLPRRQAFVAIPSRATVLRHREGSGGWTTDAVPVAALADIGLSPDGATLLVAETNGYVSLVDTTSLAVLGRYRTQNELTSNANQGPGIPVTGDGKAWLTTSASANPLLAFDLARREFEKPVFNLSTKFYGVPATLVSRNGERLLVSQANGVSPSPPLLVRDLAQAAWREVPSGPPRSFIGTHNSVDDTGSRLALEDGLYDAQFNVVGKAVAPTGWVIDSLVLSPDGARAYAVAVPTNWSQAANPAMPRVFVFDARTPLGTMTALPLLGSFDLSELPTRCSGVFDFSCRPMRTAVAADGKTLFVAGKLKLVVVPVPDTLGGAQPSRVTTRWR